VTSPRLYRVSALVLRQRELAEADRILLLLTSERGKLSALAKGVKKPRSKLAGGLQLFSHVRLLLAVGRNLDPITQCQPLESFLPLRQDLHRFALASHLAELADCFTEQGARLSGLYDLLLNSLRALAVSPEPELIGRGFELKLMNLLGYAPELSVCVSCGREKSEEKPSGAQPSIAFSVALGGLVCSRCRRGMSGLVSLSPASLEAMWRLLRVSPQETSSVSPPAKIRGELEGTLRAYLEFRLEKGLKSAVVLQALRPVPSRSGELAR